MANILIVTSYADSAKRLERWLASGLLPKGEYYVVAEFCKIPAIISPQFPNTLVIDDLSNRTSVEAAIAACSAFGPFTAIIHTDEYSVFFAAELRDRLGCIGPSRQEVLKFRDKVAMKDSLRGRVRVPRLFEPCELVDHPELFPIVAKPRSWASSRGVRILAHPGEMLASDLVPRRHVEVAAFPEFSLTDLEFEEYISGRVFHIDGLVSGGEMIFCRASEYLGTCLDYLAQKEVGSVSVSDREELEKWRVFAEQTRQAMNIPSGAFHLEAFLTEDGERVFLEIGIRCGGALIREAILGAVGVDLDLMHILCQLGVDVEVQQDDAQQFGFLIYPNPIYNGTPMYVGDITMPELATLPSLDWFRIPKRGDLATAMVVIYAVNAGTFVFKSESEQQIRQDLAAIRVSYKVEMEQLEASSSTTSASEETTGTAKFASKS